MSGGWLVMRSIVRSVTIVALVVTVMEILTLIMGVRVYHIDSSILLVLLLCGGVSMVVTNIIDYYESADEIKAIRRDRGIVFLAAGFLIGGVVTAGAFAVLGAIFYGGLLILFQQYGLCPEISFLALFCICCALTLHIFVFRKRKRR